MTESSKSLLDSYGFERSAHQFDDESYEEFMANYISILTSRLIKWQGVSDKSLKKSRKLKRYVRKGIPAEFRIKMWLKKSLIDDDVKNQELSEYMTLASKTPEKLVADCIRADLPRTYPENIYFRDTKDGLLKPLKNVLTAYANLNTNVGYVQGLNYITGMLLIITKNEVDSYLLLRQMIDNLLPDFYGPGMKGLKIECEVLASLLKMSHPDLYRHFNYHGLSMELVVTKWFVCSFVDVLPVETVLRIWDCLFFEGSKILLRVAYTLIVINKSKFLEKKDMMEILEFFKEITHDKSVLNCHKFMRLCFTVPKSMSRTQIDKFRATAAEKLGDG